MKIQEVLNMDLIDGLTTVIFEERNRLNGQVQNEIQEIFKTDSSKTLQDVITEYEETSDQYKSSQDIPMAQALIDMGTTDPGYVELRYNKIRAYKGECCWKQLVEPDEDDVTCVDDDDYHKPNITNNHAGRMDQCHFTELCVPIRNRLYRLEMKSGREIPNYRDINWIKSKIGCTLQEADKYNKIFKDLQLGKKEVYKLIFGYFSLEHMEKTSGIQDSGNELLEEFLKLQDDMKDLVLEKEDININKYDENGNDIEDEYWNNVTDQDLIELNFKEDIDFDSNLFTAKRLSIPEESLSEEEISEIKYGDYETYKKVNKRYNEEKFKFIGKDARNKNIFAKDGKKINANKISSNVSMGWVYLKEAKAKFDAEKDKLIQEAKEAGIPEYMDDALLAYQRIQTKSNKYRVTTCIFGGVWDGEVIPRATKGQAALCWKVIYSKNIRGEEW
jgi:hypothetical protein